MIAPPSFRIIAPMVLATFGLAGTALAQVRPRPSEWELTCSRPRSYDSDSERTCNIIERTIPLPAGTLSVDGSMNGGISVIGESRRDVFVRAMIEANALTRSRAEELAGLVRVKFANGRIVAEGPEDGRREWWGVSYEVHVPVNADLSLKAFNGGIAVASVRGMLRMETLNGGIHLEAVNGDVVGETTNGGLHVALGGDRWEGRGLDLTTTNGGVHLRVPTGYSAHLETGTVNGGLDIDFPVTVQGRIAKRLAFDLGRGGPPIRLMTTNGGVDIRKH